VSCPFRVVEKRVSDKELEVALFGNTKEKVELEVDKTLAGYLKNDWHYVPDPMGEEIILVAPQQYVVFLHFVKK